MISDQAIVAGLAAWGQYPVGVSPKQQMVNILEAAAPYMLKDMRLMTLVEIAARERPESMAAARAKVRADRKEAQAEMIRAARTYQP